MSSWPRRLAQALGRGRTGETTPVESTTPEASTEERWVRVTEVVNEALRRPDPRERVRYLRRACGGDRGLRQEVENLLRFEAAEDGILEGGLVRGAGEREVDRETTTEVLPVGPGGLGPGQRVGGYVVERLLGDGGMGVVALAWEEELERHVALKVIRRDRVSEEALQRFDTERRVLARLGHPAIAHLFGAGTVGEEVPGLTGLPYFTMEWVDGEPIDAYCDARCLDIEARLRLVVAVCNALEEAHRGLVVHRDLKPGNVLVTAEGQPKLLDFGIAKELDPLDSSGVTRTGQQPFTPAWASPEQVRGLPVGMATDVYSLGLVLYRLLCGHPPYTLDGDAFETVRRICEEEPPAPSSRAMVALEVWRGGAPCTVGPDELARLRGTEPRALRRVLRGDLDAIVRRALEKEPRRRYRSMEALGADLRRYLEGRPVRARRATWGYLLSKFVRRYRRWVAAGLVGLASLGAGLGAWVDGRQRVAAVEGERQRVVAQAEQAEAQAEAVSDFAFNLVLATDPDVSAGRALTAQELLDRGWEQARRTLGEEPEALAHQLEALGLAYRRLGVYGPARELLEESLVLRRQVYGRGDHRLVARGLNNLASVEHVSGGRRRAETLYRLALGIKRRLGQGPPELARVENNLGSLLVFRGEYDEAEDLFRRVLEVRRHDPEPDPAELASSLRSLGNLLYLRGDFEEAEEAFQDCLELRQERYGEKSTRTAAAWSGLGRVLHARGRLTAAAEALEQALEVRRQRLGEEHLHVALTRKDLAAVYFEQGEAEAGEALLERAFKVLRQHLSEDAWELADAERLRGERLLAAGRREEAVEKLEVAHATLQAVRGEQSLYTRRAAEALRLAREEEEDSGVP